MLEAFSARLEARNPEKKHHRSYRIDAGVDLLGDWVVDIRFGSIGSIGRKICYIASNKDDARQFVARTLQKRATAYMRIGTAYRLCELHDPYNWRASQ